MYHDDKSGYGTVVWNTLFKAEVLKHPDSLQFKQDLIIGEDADYLMNAFMRCDKVSLIPTGLYFYNKDNMTSTTYGASHDLQMKSTENKIRFLEENGFEDKDILHMKNQLHNAQLMKAIYGYVNNEEYDPQLIQNCSLRYIIKKKDVSSFKRALLILMIRLRMSRKLIRKIYEIHR